MQALVNVTMKHNCNYHSSNIRSTCVGIGLGWGWGWVGVGLRLGIPICTYDTDKSSSGDMFGYFIVSRIFVFLAVYLLYESNDRAVLISLNLKPSILNCKK